MPFHGWEGGGAFVRNKGRPAVERPHFHLPTARPLPSRGFTLVELMIASALVGVLFLGLNTLIFKIQQSLTLADARDQLKTTANALVQSLQTNLPSCIRIISDEQESKFFIDRLASQIDPAPLVGWKAPAVRVQEDPRMPLGNVFMYVARENHVDIDSGTDSVRVDLLRFHMYYPAYGPGMMIGQRERNLYHWTSQLYAKHDNLENLGGLTGGVISALCARGVMFSFDPKVTNFQLAFHKLGGGVLPEVDPAHLYQTENNVCLTKGSERMIGRYRQALAPNITAAQGYRHVVPLAGFPTVVPSGDYPSGFGIKVWGPGNERRVFVHLVLVAKGAFPIAQTHELVSIFSARDVW